MTSSIELFGESHGLPLCRRYEIVHFVVQPILVQAVGDVQSWPVTWATGTLSDGHSSVLGAWQPATAAPNWPATFDDLARRGVERIRIAIGADADAAIAAFPQVTLFNSVLHLSGTLTVSPRHDPLGSTSHAAATTPRSDAGKLPRRVRQLVRRTEEAARLLRLGLTQAAARRGPFDGPRDAAMFVEAWLENAERRERQRRYSAQRRAERAVGHLAA